MLRKVFIGMILILVVGLSVLGYLYRHEIKQTAKLVQEKTQLEQTVKNKNQAIMDLQREKKHIEEVRAKRSERQKKIVEDSRKKINKIRSELKELRSKYEEVNDFLDIRVPAEFVAWLRKKNSNENGSDKSSPAGKSDNETKNSGKTQVE